MDYNTCWPHLRLALARSPVSEGVEWLSLWLDDSVLASRTTVDKKKKKERNRERPSARDQGELDKAIRIKVY